MPRPIFYRSHQSAGVFVDRPCLFVVRRPAKQSRLPTLLGLLVSTFSSFPPGVLGWFIACLLRDFSESPVRRILGKDQSHARLVSDSGRPRPGTSVGRQRQPYRLRACRTGSSLEFSLQPF